MRQDCVNDKDSEFVCQSYYTFRGRFKGSRTLIEVSFDSISEARDMHCMLKSSLLDFGIFRVVEEDVLFEEPF
jgi:hypothetical protein